MFALWWLEEGSYNGLHFDQAFVAFMVLYNLIFSLPMIVQTLDMQELPNEVKEEYLRRATLLMHSQERSQDAAVHPSGQDAVDQPSRQVERSFS